MNGELLGELKISKRAANGSGPASLFSTCLPASGPRSFLACLSPTLNIRRHTGTACESDIELGGEKAEKA